MIPAPDNIDVVILCGGEGKRLQSAVKDRPKPMADINNRPFLDILIQYIASFGFKRFILCLGCKAKFIKEYYEKKQSDYTILYSQEDKPLGTGGAMSHALSLIKGDLFLGMNGDSFIKIDVNNFVRFHISKNGVASIVITEVAEVGEYGMISMDNNQRILSFCEKTGSRRTALVNAGIYLMDKNLLNKIPSNKNYSLERDFFPGIINSSLFGYVTDESLIDIGTPDRLESAKLYLKAYKGR